MRTLLLKALAVIVGLLALLIIMLKQLSIGIGVRTTQKTFTDEIANMKVSTWLLIILILIELVLVSLLLFFSKSRA